MKTVFETERLIIRSWTLSETDVVDAFAMYGDPDVTLDLQSVTGVPDGCQNVARPLVNALVSALGHFVRSTGACPSSVAYIEKSE